MFKKRFDELQKNFSGFEKIKKFKLLPKEFTIDAGELTATLKIKRKVIYKKYKEIIDSMYGEKMRIKRKSDLYKNNDIFIFKDHLSDPV
ncbi:MAG: hypothetical protein DSY82_08050 [Flavobacteriia bacterium]|nr:MAG: hypothetical protein DSY82_08050 [Flavobacteriia bacterium]